MLIRRVQYVVGTLPEKGSPALASIMAEASDRQSRVVGEKSTYAIDASGQKGDVRNLSH